MSKARAAKLKRPKPGPNGLTPREDDVLQLMAKSVKDKDIGARLGVNPKSVKNYRMKVYRVLGVSSQTEAVRVAIARGMISPDPLE